MEWLETLLDHLPWIFSGVGVVLLGLIIGWLKWSFKKIVDQRIDKRIEHSLKNGGGKIIESKINKANEKQTKQLIEIIKLGGCRH